MARLSLTINGQAHDIVIDDNVLLVHLLRDRLGLTGTHIGCDTSQCGACVVHVDGKSVKSCSILAAQIDGSQILTIEGLAQDSELHPLQEAFNRFHALQCGFCTPGMIMSALDLLQTIDAPTEQQVNEWLEGNLCRCTGYRNIVAAILSVAQLPLQDRKPG